MSYVQMTLKDWAEMKRELRRELLGVKQSFVRIGYALRKIDDQKLYERDGYKSIVEFAKEECGLEPSTTSRFMSINREYSIDGYSEALRPEYADLGRSQLEEMLKLPDGDRKMIQQETSREDIRELKRFNKVEPEAGVADDIRQLVEKFYEDNPAILNAAFSEPEFEESTIKRFAEIVNPGGNRSYKKGLYFLMMYENRVAVKKFGTDPENMTWWEFWQITRNVFADTAAGPRTWQNHFGGGETDRLLDDGERTDAEVDPQNEENEPGRGRITAAPIEPEGDGTVTGEIGMNEKKEDWERGGEDHEDVSGTGEAANDAEGEEADKGACQESAGRENKESAVRESRGKEIAPAQKVQEILEGEASDEAENEKNNGDAKGENAKSETEEKMEETESDFTAITPEVIEKPFGSRKDWLDTLTAYGMALELAGIIKAMLNENPADMTKTEFWEHCLYKEVDERGYEVN